jgi:hypothetical protein
MIYDIGNRNREVRRTGNNGHDEKENQIEDEKMRASSSVDYFDMMLVE